MAHHDRQQLLKSSVLLLELASWHCFKTTRQADVTLTERSFSGSAARLSGNPLLSRRFRRSTVVCRNWCTDPKFVLQQNPD